MWLLLSTLAALCLYAVIRLLNLASPSLPPNIYVKSRHSQFVQALLASCPIFERALHPSFTMGEKWTYTNGCVCKIGRMRDPVPRGSRHTKTLQDGSTLTFDLYMPTGSAPTTGETYCMMICPGFGSSSESSYIRALVTQAQASGYHVAVLNHLGCLFSLRLTAPRIFSYGGWEEYDIMRREVECLYPQCKLIMVGLSMGANIVLKYLGENRQHQRNVLCAFSICQGYNINEGKHLLKKWQNMRRAYLYTMTANQRRLLKHHSQVLFSEEVRQNFGVDLPKVFSATTLEELDLQFSCKLQGFTDVVDYYEHHSCSNYIGNIDIPLVLLNSEDDPIVPTPLFRYAQDYTESHEKAVFITTKHGGHLGFFESGFIRPHPISWIDRFVCQLADAIVAYAMQEETDSNFDSETESLPTQPLQKDATTAATPQHSEADLSNGEGTSPKTKPSQSENGGVPILCTDDDWMDGEGSDNIDASPSSTSSLANQGSMQASAADGRANFMGRLHVLKRFTH